MRGARTHLLPQCTFWSRERRSRRGSHRASMTQCSDLRHPHARTRAHHAATNAARRLQSVDDNQEERVGIQKRCAAVEWGIGRVGVRRVRMAAHQARSCPQQRAERVALGERGRATLISSGARAGRARLGSRFRSATGEQQRRSARSGGGRALSRSGQHGSLAVLVRT